jgi:predicted metal-dependent peptidase
MKTREELESVGNQILNSVRTELYLSMRFMGSALGSLGFRMDLSTRTVGTDAVWIRFNPTYLLQTYLERPEVLNRTYMHMLMHCLFRHMFAAKDHEDAELWDLCCDIAAESVVDSMDYPTILRVSSDFRQEWYEKLESELHVLTAEKIYHYFILQKRDPYLEESLRQEFALCDHSFWARMQDEDGQPSAESKQNVPQDGQASSESKQNVPQDGQASSESRQNAPQDGQASSESKQNVPQDGQTSSESMNDASREEATPLGAVDPKEDEWRETAKRIESEMETFAKDGARDAGQLLWLLHIQNRSRRSYKEFLKRFSVVREEVSIDMDSFDYGFYMHGLSLYGNMPLIEENEYREVKKVEELVIAIDTSASCRDKLVQQFLNETGAILKSHESFFQKVRIRIIECDNQIQRDVEITNLDEIEDYAQNFKVQGGYGTDFRPVFAYVEQLRTRGELRNLKGLMYFTDGFGEYPKKPTDYDTVFVFYGDDEHDDTHVPDWALALYLEEAH